MLEIAMCICLTIMGIYFVKSTDLPKELRDRSVHMESKKAPRENFVVNKISISKKEPITMNKELELNSYYEELDKLTLTITALEQEIKVNNTNNSKIKKMIDVHLVSFQLIKDKINSLS